MVISSTLLHRTESIVSFKPYKNYVWTVMAVVWYTAAAICYNARATDQLSASLGAQVVFCVVSLSAGPLSLFRSLPWYFWLLAFGWLVPLLAIQERVTHLDKRQFVRFQKRSKLEFNTRLGMHSPV